MWFGHGTKPKDGVVDRKPVDLGTVAARIRNLGLTLVASMPSSKRYHNAARLTDDDRGRLERVMTGAVRALPLGDAQIARRVMGVHPASLGVAAFIDAGRLLNAATSYADAREASDKLATSAQEMGLDRFKPFLRQADDHFASQGGLGALAAELLNGLNAAARPVPGPVSIQASTLPTAAEQEHGAFWWWLHDLGLAHTQHEKANLLRRAMGSAGGSIYIRDGKILDVDNMSDDDVLALERETRGQRPTALPPGVAAPTKTSWGWDGQPGYEAAKRELNTPGTHETLNGTVPTEDEAKRMIEEIGGRIDRIEDGHGPSSVSSHNQRHINYYVKRQDGSFEKATV